MEGGQPENPTRTRRTAAPNPPEVSAPGKPAAAQRNPQPRVPLWTKDFALGTLVNFLLMVNYYGLMVVVADYAMKTYGAPASLAGLAASIFIIGALVARLVSGRIMDRVGRKRLLVLGAAFEVAFSLLYLADLGIAPLFAIRLLHGIAYGACSTTIGTIVTALVPHARKGEGVGYYMLSVTLGAAIGPFLGMFLAQNAGYQVLFATTAAVAGDTRPRGRWGVRPCARLPRAPPAPAAFQLPRSQRAAHRRRVCAAVLLLLQPAHFPDALRAGTGAGRCRQLLLRGLCHRHVRDAPLHGKAFRPARR